MERFERILQYCQVKYCHTEVFYFSSIVILNESYCEISLIILPTSNPYALFAQQKQELQCKAHIFFFIFPPFLWIPLLSPSLFSLSIWHYLSTLVLIELSSCISIVCDGHSDLKKHLGATYLWAACGVELLSCISEGDSTFIGGYEENYNVAGTTALVASGWPWI